MMIFFFFLIFPHFSRPSKKVIQLWKALPPVTRLMLFSLLSFFHFILRFWNQILICLSERHRAWAISILRRLVRYLLKWNSFSSSSVWYRVYAVRALFPSGPVISTILQKTQTISNCTAQHTHTHTTHNTHNTHRPILELFGLFWLECGDVAQTERGHYGMSWCRGGGGGGGGGGGACNQHDTSQHSHATGIIIIIISTSRHQSLLRILRTVLEKKPRCATFPCAVLRLQLRFTWSPESTQPHKDSTDSRHTTATQPPLRTHATPHRFISVTPGTT